ncbi:MAG: hypothetical protein F6K47_13800 [Symploca sp. SIO2E6]|nr:hypothetical protein [Symploca sp. SIO2E6]
MAVAPGKNLTLAANIIDHTGQLTAVGGGVSLVAVFNRQQATGKRD